EDPFALVHGEACEFGGQRVRPGRQVVEAVVARRVRDRDYGREQRRACRRHGHTGQDPPLPILDKATQAAVARLGLNWHREEDREHDQRHNRATRHPILLLRRTVPLPRNGRCGARYSPVRKVSREDGSEFPWWLTATTGASSAGLVAVTIVTEPRKACRRRFQ